MRYILVFISILFFNTAFSQDHLVNESFYNTPLKKAISELEKNYGIYFSYSTVILENVTVNVEIQGSSIEEAMGILLLGTGIDYRLVKRKYIILNM